VKYRRVEHNRAWKSGAVAERHRKEEFGWRVKHIHLHSDLSKL
jgi:hypothetical protein